MEPINIGFAAAWFAAKKRVALAQEAKPTPECIPKLAQTY